MFALISSPYKSLLIIQKIMNNWDSLSYLASIVLLRLIKTQIYKLIQLLQPLGEKSNLRKVD